MSHDHISPLIQFIALFCMLQLFRWLCISFWINKFFIFLSSPSWEIFIIKNMKYVLTDIFLANLILHAIIINNQNSSFLYEWIIWILSRMKCVGGWLWFFSMTAILLMETASKNSYIKSWRRKASFLGRNFKAQFFQHLSKIIWNI